MVKVVENTDRSECEYLLVADLGERVGKRVIDIKRDFAETYKQKKADETRSCITIANFAASESMEETVIRWMQRICGQFRGFPVTLNNYSGFPSHSIYIRVQNHEPFHQLASQLKVIDQYVTSNGFPPSRLVAKPHITIATGLDKPLYDKALLEYSQKTFHEAFDLDGLVLLKRNSQFDKCKEVNVFRFYPPDTNIYGKVA